MTNKHIRLIAVLLLCALHALAQAPDPYPLNVTAPGTTVQDVVDAMYQNSQPGDDTVEGGYYKKIQFIEKFWQDRATENDNSGVNMFDQYFGVFKAGVQTRKTVSCTGNWKCFGPDSLNLQQMGKVDALWVDPADSNYILAGTLGGLFKTINGGLNWNCITNEAPVGAGIAGINWIAVNPLNKNTIYLGTKAEGNFFAASPNGAGILKSFDGGLTWQQEFIDLLGDGLNISDSVEAIQKVYFTPDSTRIYAFLGRHVFTRSNSGTPGNWIEITPAGVPDSRWYDLEFAPWDPTMIYISNTVAGSMTKAGIWVTGTAVPDSTQWTKLTAGLVMTARKYKSDGIVNGVPVYSYVTFTEDGFGRFEMSIADNNEMYVVGVSALDRRHTILLKYAFSGGGPLWTLLNQGIALPYDRLPDHSRMELVVSTAATSNNFNRRNIYYGTDIPLHSFDGGNTFTIIGNYLPDPNAPTHADIRAIVLHKATNSLRGVGDRVYLATDGGVSKKLPGTDDSVSREASTININGKGLTCGHFWSVATSEAGGLVMAGSMHNGFAANEPKQAAKWNAFTSGDTYSTMFDKADREKAYGISGYDKINLEQTTPAINPGGRLMDYLLADVFPPESGAIVPPLAASENNIQAMGLKSLWERNLPTSWVAFDAGLTLGSETIHSIAATPYADTFTGYVITRSNGQPKLYYKNPGQQQIPFVEITPLPRTTEPLASITLDPAHPERVWIGFGAISWGAPNVNRIYYSPDAGANWHDVSTGLPYRVPIVKLVYHEGQNTLYCATDVGIYKCDFSNFNPTDTVGGFNHSIEWTCFSKGADGGEDFPNGYVTDLQINHCQGKLYASTYGRSIWATDLIGNTDVLGGYTTTITSNTNWSGGRRYLNGNVLVTSGNTLTISGDTTIINMPKNGRITVEPGAKLIVTDATITNSCENCMWLGIEAKGDASLPQTGNNQGKVTLTNARIEHARNATMNWGAYSGGGGASCGGIIQATGTQFINCRRSAAFNEYKNGINKNTSFYRQCQFIINEGYKGDANSAFEEQAALYNVNGVKFYGCEFYNRLTNAQKGLGIGIHIAGGGGEVYDYNPMGNNPIHNKFVGFKFGVFAEAGSMPNYKTYIDGAIFDSCGIGIRGLNDQHIVTTNNNFSVGKGTFAETSYSDCYKNIGIFLTNCMNAIVEENTATGVTPATTQSGFERMGIVIDQSGGNDKQVYRNTLTGLEFGVLAINENNLGAPSGLQPGLRITCNTFQNNIRDIHVTTSEADLLALPLTNGIAIHQGSPSLPAENKFLTSTTSPVKLTNNGFGFEYYRYVSGSQNNPAPVAYLPPYSPFASYVNIKTVSSNNTCPTRYGGGGIPNTAIGRGTFRDGYFAASALKQGLISDYAALVDGGSFELLRDHINTYILCDSLTAYDTLIDLSPWLSREIIVHVADAAILPDYLMKEVVLANPEMIDEDLITYLGPSGGTAFPIEEVQLTDLEDAMIISTARTDMEAEISLQGSEMEYFANAMLSHLLVDTLQDEADSIPVWYNRMNTVKAEYDKISYYTGMSDFAAAEHSISQVGSKFTLTTQQTDELALHDQLYNVLKNIRNDGRSIMEINSDEIAQIVAIHDDAVDIGAKQIIFNTKGIIEAPGPQFKLACPYLNPLTSAGKQTTASERVRKKLVRSKPTSDRIQAYPNPASDRVTFAYSVVKPQAELHITITDGTGKIARDIRLAQPSGSLHLDTKQFAPGLYIYKLTDGNKTIDVGKVMIVK